MTTLQNYPAHRPSLLLDFARSKRLHPQLRFTRASTATCYTPSGKLRTVANNVPRIDYEPKTGRCLGLLVEPTRTNTALNSDTFSSWTKSRSTVADTAVPSPDPAKFAKKLVDNTELNEHVVNYAFTPAASTTYVFSCFLKAAERNFAFISIRNFANQTVGWSVSIDLTTYQTYGAPTSTAGETLTITPLPDGWCRVSLSTTTIAAPVGTINPTIGVKDSLTASGTYVGDGTSGVYIFGAQVEVGSSPSSYIPTTSAAVTRAAEVAYLDVQDALTREGFSWAMEGSGDYSGEYPCIFSDSVNALGGYAGVRFIGAGSNVYINSLEGGRSAGAGTRPAAGSWFRVAASVANDASGGISLNGATGAGQMRDAVDFSTRRWLKFGAVTSAANGIWRIGRIAIYRQTLTTTQLQRLTAA
ncbi:hypothetical protein LZ683_09505 [Comamonas testosteroni]|uniref:phage head spike fiber domain-containing protein n=1 Tax=Comamonas testosteroni TaxID=285 RepID=UPI0023AA4F6D|nr:hypothetical protein [Comamonas testosteroni]WEE79567.1 hypothetical protein LZ683_09505 [Comamonas testosteroni]